MRREENLVRTNSGPREPTPSTPLPGRRPRSACDCGDVVFDDARRCLRASFVKDAAKEDHLAPSAVGRSHRLKTRTIESVFRHAMSIHARGADPDSQAASSVVWRDGDDELLVVPA